MRPGRSRRRVLRGALALGSFALLGGCGTLPESPPTAEPVRRIGVLVYTTRRESPALELFVRGLRERGWELGRNLSIDWREAQGQPGRYRQLANELIKLGVEVIVAQTSGMVEAARAATTTIPIVSLGLPSDPVALGWATSLARPGRNVTGTVISRDLEAKRVELLKELMPGLSRLGILWSGRPDPSVFEGVALIESAARSLGLEPISLEVSSLNPRLDEAFAEATGQRVEALVVYQSAQLNPLRAQIVERVGRAGIPAVYPTRAYVADGGLMSYGPDFNELFGRTARHVDEILKGANPAELPFEHPASYILVLNARVVKTLNLTVPQSVLQQVTEIVE
jgi:putative ABC transport system substrate-binding protein